MSEPSLTTKHKEALDHPVRKRIYDYLLGEKEPQTLGAISVAIDASDIAVVHYYVNRLAEIQLVEKVWGTNFYRVVKR